MRLVTVVLLSSVLLPGFVRAQEQPSVASLTGPLGHQDPHVRQEAGKALLSRGFVVMAPVTGAARSGHPLVAREAERVRRALLLAQRLRGAPAGSAAFWMAFEEVFLCAPSHLQEGVLHLALESPKTVYELRLERDRARETVRVFCLEWNEMYAPGSEEEKRYTRLRERLLECGAAAAPHLLRVLEANDRLTFFRLDPVRGVSARMQVRAIFGVSFLELREAIPHLLIHTRGMSFTGNTNAAATILLLTKKEISPPFTKPDLERIDGWWKEHRGEFEASTRRLGRAVATDLKEGIAREIAGRGDLDPDSPVARILQNPEDLLGPKNQARSVALLELLTGKDFVFDPEATAEERLAAARAIVEQLERENWRWQG